MLIIFSSSDSIRTGSALLNGEISIIKVGGKSEVEMKERKDRIEDATLAVQCALEEGIVEGGGYALMKIAPSLDNEFHSCLLTPYTQIFWVEGEKYQGLDLDGNMFKQNIIDPLKVTRCALQNAISVAKTILGTGAMVLNERLWK